MSNKKQVTKNFDLTSKLANFILRNPKKSKDIPSGTTYVVFSSVDKELNKLNEKLVQGYLKRGKPVVKATEKEKTKNIWDLRYITP